MRLLGLLILGILLGVVAAWGFQFVSHRSAASADSSAAGRLMGSAASGNEDAAKKRLIFARGTLEPRGGVILVSSPLAGARVQKVVVQDGDQVAANAVLMELDSAAIETELRLAEAQRLLAAEQQRAEVQSAEQRLTLATLALKQLEQSRALEIEVQQKQLNLAEKKLNQAEDDLRRLQSARRGAEPMSDAPLEQQRTLVDIATAERDAVQAALNRLKQSLGFALEKAEAEQRAAKQAVETAQRSPAIASFDRQISLAQHKLDQTRVLAPAAGTVISVLAHPGELANGQPLVQLADLDALVCQAEVDVADVFSIKENQEAWITCRALPAAKIRGRVERVRNRAAPATLRPADPRQPVDRTVATVLLSVDAGEVARQLRASATGAPVALVGLQVDVEIPQ